jgi:hypothetical protein
MMRVGAMRMSNEEAHVWERRTMLVLGERDAQEERGALMMSQEGTMEIALLAGVLDGR